MQKDWVISMTERIETARARIAELRLETTVAEPFRDYFRAVADFLLLVSRDADNRAMYADILPEHYGASYANPDFAAAKLGAEYGPLLSAVYAELRGIIPAVFEGDDEGQAVLYELFLGLYFEFENDEPPKPQTVRDIFVSYLRDYMPDFVEKRLRAQVDPSESFARDIVCGTDLTELSYLYRYGEYVSEDTVRTAKFLNSLPEETIERMAETYTEGYRLGFVHAKKDLSKKRTVQIIFELGFERMIRRAVERFAAMGLQPTFVRYSPNLVTKAQNRRAGYTGAIKWSYPVK